MAGLARLECTAKCGIDLWITFLSSVFFAQAARYDPLFELSTVEGLTKPCSWTNVDTARFFPISRCERFVLKPARYSFPRGSGI
jgi:hypothetical protein